MILRPYQTEAVAAIWRSMQSGYNPVAVLPTGSGKTPVLAELCRQIREWGGRAICLTHVPELVAQAADKLRAVAPGLPFGVCYASLGERDYASDLVLAGIQTAYRSPEKFGKRDVAIVDEAHMIPADGEGMYRTLLSGLGNPPVIGLTATPYRMTSGSIVGKDQLFTSIAYEASVRKLIDCGYLAPLVAKCGITHPQLAEVAVVRGEFASAALEEACCDVVAAACLELIQRAQGRKSILVFCQGVRHAKRATECLLKAGQSAACVVGDSLDREQNIAKFKAGEIRFLVSVNVLTTGFDAPNVDCLAILRPTMSPVLHAQILGRGMRTAPGKANCLVLDFAGNIVRHGPVDAIDFSPREKRRGDPDLPRVRVCDACRGVSAAWAKKCRDCGVEFERPEREAKHDQTAGDAEPMATPTTLAVQFVDYNVHHKRGDPDAPPTMRVTYTVGVGEDYSEWVCVEHGGYAGKRASEWWAARCDSPMPDTVEQAVREATNQRLREPTEIVVQRDGKYMRVIGHIGLNAAAKAAAAGQEEELPF